MDAAGVNFCGGRNLSSVLCAKIVVSRIGIDAKALEIDVVTTS